MPATFTKTGQGHANRVEAAGLAWLAEAEADGGARIVKVIRVDDDSLVIERVAESRSNVVAARAFGTGLAHTHAAGAPWHGAAPPGVLEDGTIGQAAMSFCDEGLTWGQFYARHRVAPYVQAAIDAGAFPFEKAALFDRVINRLEDGEFDSPMPALVTAPAGRLHGDLWAGNVLWTDHDAVLIDPAAHGGHPETDLAMLQLFGLAHLDQVVDAYQDVSPIADGWEERLPLHLLWPLLVHTVLFGGGYIRQVLGAVARLA